MKKINIIGIAFLVSGLLFTSCKKDNEEEEDTVDFNKSELLTNIGTNLIVPEYQQFLDDILNLESTYIQFSSDKTASNLELVRTAWKTAYINWYSVNCYEFGPAMSVGLRSAVGTYPSDTVKILNNISTGGYVLGSVENIDAIGLSSLDFFLYRSDALNHFISSSTYTQYALELIQKMKNEITSVVNSWNSTYLAIFKNSTGTESTSSFSLFVNEFNKTYELAKNAKLGIPIGKQSLGIQRPEYIEARLSAFSMELLEENVKAIHRIFNGNTKSGTEGIGFDDYLIALDRAALASSINSQFAAILNDIDQITLSLEEEMIANPAALDALYTKMQNLVVSIKTDMSSSFGVLITYQDNDGD